MAQHDISPRTETPTSDAIARGAFVKRVATGSNAGRIEQCDTAGEESIGVALDESPAMSTKDIRVAPKSKGGICEVKAGGSFEPGDPITNAADGEAIEATTTGHNIHAHAVKSAVAGDEVEVELGSGGKV